MQKNIVNFGVASKEGAPIPSEGYGLPDYYELEPTRGCNLKCRMCHVSFMEDSVAYLDINAIKDFSFLRGKAVSIGAVFEPCIHPRKIIA